MVRISFLTCVFLIGLRLVIGWHFFFEGVSKYESTQHAGALNNKPFSSKGYFAEAAGPAGARMREFIGDDDAIAIAKLTPDDKSDSKMPAILDKEWDDYLASFVSYYKLNDDDKKAASDKLNLAKTEYVLWLTDTTPKPKEGKDAKKADEPKKIKKKVVASGAPVEYEVDDKVQPRLKEYEDILHRIHDYYSERLPEMGNVENRFPIVRTLKTEAAALRSELMKDVDEKTNKMKSDLATIVAKKLKGFDIGDPKDKLVDDRVMAMLALKPGDSNHPDASQMPAALDKQWDEYYTFYKEVGHNSPQNDPKRGDAIVADAKLGYVRFLSDRDQFTGHALPDQDVSKRVAAYRAAVDKWRKVETQLKQDPTIVITNIALVVDGMAAMAESERLRQSFIDDITNQTEYMKKGLGGFTDDGFKGIAPTPATKSTVVGQELPANNLEWLDWATRWGILVAGGCLLIGLFTRLACLGCICFLAVEFLSNSPWPWLPASPKSEGNYVFINKNMVELMALLVLATLPTGRWLGLDALLSRLSPFGRGKR